MGPNTTTLTGHRGVNSSGSVNPSRRHSLPRTQVERVCRPRRAEDRRAAEYLSRTSRTTATTCRQYSLAWVSRSSTATLLSLTPDGRPTCSIPGIPLFAHRGTCDRRRAASEAEDPPRRVGGHLIRTARTRVTCASARGHGPASRPFPPVTRISGGGGARRRLQTLSGISEIDRRGAKETEPR